MGVAGLFFRTGRFGGPPRLQASALGNILAVSNGSDSVEFALKAVPPGAVGRPRNPVPCER